MRDKAKAVAQGLRHRWFPALVGFAIGLVLGVVLSRVYDYLVTINRAKDWVYP